MVFPNLLALLALSGTVAKMAHEDEVADEKAKK